MINELGDQVSFYKLGLELMMSDGYFSLLELLQQNGKKIFADLKLYDIPQTVGNAVKNLSSRKIDFLTIHTASEAIMQSAVANKGKMKILGVTTLTCLDKNDLAQMGFDSSLSMTELVLQKAQLALKCGLDGVVASAQEARILRQELGQDFLIITPGIRQDLGSGDDQKRVANVDFAIKSGASHLVVGRPITAAPNPKQAAKNFLQLIDEALRSSF